MFGQELFDHIKNEWGTLSKAPFAFVGLAVISLTIGFAAGFGSGRLYLGDQVGSLHEQLNAKDAKAKVKNEELAAKDAQISRYGFGN